MDGIGIDQIFQSEFSHCLRKKKCEQKWSRDQRHCNGISSPNIGQLTSSAPEESFPFGEQNKSFTLTNCAEGKIFSIRLIDSDSRHFPGR